MEKFLLCGIVSQGGDLITQNSNQLSGSERLFLCPLFEISFDVAGLVVIFFASAPGKVKERYE